MWAKRATQINSKQKRLPTKSFKVPMFGSLVDELHNCELAYVRLWVNIGL